MATHRVGSSLGGEFEIVVDESGRITDVAGEWPEDQQEFELTGDIPEHATLESAPRHLTLDSAAEGEDWDVCFYDDKNCRTCYCRRGKMRCVRMC